MTFQPTTYGKYVLLDRIAVGGMAEVFKAKTYGVHGFERLLVIKRILPHLSKDEEFVQMFIDEAKIVVELMHANICQVTDLGKIGDNYFIAMEYIEGKDLRAILKKCISLKLPLTIPQTIYIAIEILKGLDYAHKKTDPLTGKPLGLIHRDISPQNIMVSYHGDVKIVDFGIAKTESKLSKTHSGVLKGKFGYMSPEQAQGLELDQQTDIFSTGIIFYEMLTRRRLFLGDTDFETLEKIKECVIPSPIKYNSAITPEIETLLQKLLGKEREDRFASAQEAYVSLSTLLYTHHPTFSSNDLSVFLKKIFAQEIDHEQESLRRTLDALGKENVLQAQNAAEISRERVIITGSKPSPSQPGRPASSPFSVLPWLAKFRNLKSLQRLSSPKIVQVAFFVLALSLGAGLGWKLLRLASDGKTKTNTIPPVVTGRASVQIASDPPGAKLLIDGVARGTTPASLDLAPKKWYLARFEKKGFKPLEKQIFISEDQKIYSHSLQPDLPAFGILHVYSTPPGAKIFIDQTPTSYETPAALKDVSLNVGHIVKVELEGYKSEIAKVILDKAEKEIEFDLKPNTVTLRLKIQPENATVHLDGQERGHVIEKVAAGKEHLLKIEASGYQTISRKITLVGPKEEALNIELKKLDAMLGTVTLRAHPYALIYVDGKLIHQGPGVADHKLPVGTHLIEFRHPYYKSISKKVTIKSGKNEPVVIYWKS